MVERSERKRRMADALKTLWRDASTLKRALLIGVPVTVFVVAAAGVGFAMSSGGSEASPEVLAPTQASDTPTSAPPTATWTAVPTDTPASAGLQADSTPPPSSGS